MKKSQCQHRADQAPVLDESNGQTTKKTSVRHWRRIAVLPLGGQRRRIFSGFFFFFQHKKRWISLTLLLKRVVAQNKTAGLLTDRQDCPQFRISSPIIKRKKKARALMPTSSPAYTTRHKTIIKMHLFRQVKISSTEGQPFNLKRYFINFLRGKKPPAENRPKQQGDCVDNGDTWMPRWRHESVKTWLWSCWDIDQCLTATSFLEKFPKKSPSTLKESKQKIFLFYLHLYYSPRPWNKRLTYINSDLVIRERKKKKKKKKRGGKVFPEKSRVLWRVFFI